MRMSAEDVNKLPARAAAGEKRDINSVVIIPLGINNPEKGETVLMTAGLTK